MTIKKRRRDTATRIVTEPERRKRRNLSDYPGLNLGNAAGGGDDTDPSGCLNAAPFDAGDEWCTEQTVSEVAGHVYEIVNLADRGIVAGVDNVTFCFEGRVGPGAGPIDLSCDGKLGLLDDGLLLYENWWDHTFNGWTGTGISGRHYDGVSGEYYVTMPCGGKMEYEGIAPREEYCIKGRIEIISGAYRDPIGGFHAASGSYWGGGAKGFASSYRVMMGEDVHGPTVFNADSNNYYVEPTFWSKSGEQGIYGLAQSQVGMPLITNDLTFDGVEGYPGIFTACDVPADYTRDGSRKFFPLWVMKNNHCIFQNVPTGWSLALWDRDDDHYWGPGVYHDEADLGGGVVDFDLRFERVPGLRLEVYDGPFGTLMFTCEPARGFYGGDVWELCPDGDCSTAVFTGDARATISMQFLSKQGTGISGQLFEPVGADTEAFTRNFDTHVSGIPVHHRATDVLFTSYKRGTDDAFACVRNLQFNVGDVCCEFSPPGSVANLADSMSDNEQALYHFVATTDVVEMDIDGDNYNEAHVERIYDLARSDGTPTGAEVWTGEQVGDTWHEHRNAPINLMGFDGHEEKAGPGAGAAGAPETGAGYQYTIIDVDKFGVIPGEDRVSLRFKAKVV